MVNKNTPIRLTIELVPVTCWASNVRSCVSDRDWDTIRRASYRAASNKCELCAGRGPKHPVECHEVWTYDDKTLIQKLERMIALCPACHRVKHIGLSELRGQGEESIDHLAKVNGWDLSMANKYVQWAFETWQQRSRKKWSLDLSLLDSMGIQYKVDRKNK
jgi:hypothetical protein